MNGVKIKDISGLLIEKKQEPDAYCASALEIRGIREHNKVINQQGEKRIGLNREKLAKRMYLSHLSKLKVIPLWEDYSDGSPTKNVYYQLADAIIANQADILEVVE